MGLARVLACFALVAGAGAGCQSAPPLAELSEDAIRTRWLAWIGDGQTNRGQVVRQLGEPTRTYEDGRIVGYVLYLSDPRCDVTPSSFRARYARGFGKLQPDTQLLAVPPGPPANETTLRTYLSPATFDLVLAYDRDVVRAHALLRSAQ